MFTMDRLMSAETAALRKMRKLDLLKMEQRSEWIVHVEIRAGHFFELDADNLVHAVRLCRSWVDNHGAVSAACRKVHPDGTLSKIVGTIYAGDFWEDEDHE